MSNKHILLKASLELFNAQGTGNVSINQIMRETGISAGNLYYYFRNKEDIILSLFDDMVQEFDHLILPILDGADLGAYRNYVYKTFALAGKYRFFHREYPVLLDSLPLLRDQYQTCRHTSAQQHISLFAAAVNKGYLSSAIIEELPQLLDDLWMVHAFWIPHLEIRDGDITEKGIQDGIRFGIRIIAPYFTEETRRFFQEYVAEPVSI